MIRAVRGAITVDNNYENEILEATKLVLENIIQKNEISKDDIISIFFTMTKDLNATFPAKAARMMGMTNVALMDATEIDVPKSLEKCIRILLTYNTDKKNEDIKNIYLKEAKKLRPDISGGNK